MDSCPSRNGVSEDSVSCKVVRAVAARANEDPADLPHLHDVIDTDALDDVFASRNDDASRSTGKVIFPYAGFRVTVLAEGSVEVEPRGALEE